MVAERRDSSARYDLVIIGMGSCGLTAAEFANTLELRVAVIERARVGGDCLWTGCVPSKALLASAKTAHVMRHAHRYGMTPVEPEIDLEAVWTRIRDVQMSIAQTDDDPQRYRDMGIDIIEGSATIIGPNEVMVDGIRLVEGRFILLCTGSRPAVPAIAGLHDVGFITSETLFQLDRPPASMVMIGGGPIGIEMAQAFVRLGIPTTVLQQGSTILPRDEPALVSVLSDGLRREGVDLRLNATTTSVEVEVEADGAGDGDGDGGAHGSTKLVHAIVDGVETRVRARGLLVATGRRANVDDLGLEALGIEISATGIVVDSRGRTSVKTIYAAGDVAGRHLFTHSAGYEGVRAVRDMFFPGRGSVDDFIPWCTFTDPELAHAGFTSAEAEARFGNDVELWRLDLSHNDRARSDGTTDGAIIVVTAKGRIVGAHILASGAGEMIHELALAIRQEMRLSDVASLVHVYPTLSTGIGQLAAESAFEKAQRLRWLVRRGVR
jgi:pyruvate/2-oxoglutarate dehydrogenase complex dihydrolipoamide dehydrogenase (E3) component